MDTVVQWSIRGLRSNFKELKLLLNRSQSTVVALQECRVGEGQVPPRGYTLLLPQVSKLSLAELFEQLPKPFLVLGVFNAHSPAGGGTPAGMGGGGSLRSS
ncbi:hypothetical protein PoB_000780600 [Plakobranchus ocellatus]|uniref:Endonuclease/exonuclease/phosphatase domain-containing protein n=1 Tax=Plakobranchus ocellatus TaxID=259542 RepID=A0AAV3YDP4_9GAST|nr:hypothetical protein PoB_000780600 [Plakobranchus ocellatus]